MGSSNMLKVGAFAAVFGGSRHQGRHRSGPTATGETRSGRISTGSGQLPAATVEQMNQAIAPSDFYVVFPNVPALPGNPGA